MLCWRDFAEEMKVCPLIMDFVTHWDPCVDERTRRQLLRPLCSHIVRSRGTVELEDQRAWRVLDWTIRTAIPLWLGPVEELEHMAVGLRSYPEITAPRETLTTLLGQTAEAAAALAETLENPGRGSAMHLKLLASGWGGAVFAAYRINWDCVLGDVSRVLSNASIVLHTRGVDMSDAVSSMQSSARFLILKLANMR